MWDLAIKNGTCVTSTESFKADIYVKDGKIAAITTEDLGPSKETLDASGKKVYAGFIDTHVHSRDGGALHKETFAHSTRGAAMGGITTVVEMPNAVPPVCNVENFKAQKANLSSKAFVDFAMWALCVGDLNNKDLLELDKYGVAGYKFFWGYALKKSNYNLIYNYDPNDPDVFPPLDDGQVYGIFETVAKTGKLLGIHAENSSLIRRLTERVKPEEYATEYEALLACRPSVCEETVVQTAISFAKVTGCHLHILHTSAKETVDLVDAAQKKGLKVTAETCPHYLTLTKDDFKRVGPMIKGYPPVREKADQQRLWEGLRAGILSHVCSDHAPHTAQEKAGSLFKIPSGMCTIETLVPLMTDSVNKGLITENDIARILSEKPAELFGLDHKKGFLRVGMDADITLVDYDYEETIDINRFQSVSKVSAFNGFKLKGYPVATVLRGHIVMKDRKLIGEHQGEFVAAHLAKKE